MASPLIALRYFYFVFFIICNAIIAGLSAWNLSMAKDLFDYSPSVDAYLVFLGVFGVVFMIPIIFFDLFRKNAHANTVWFELGWVWLFWILELAGGAALAAKLPKLMCNAIVTAFVSDPCTSTRVLLAFSWLATIASTIYLLALGISAVLHKDEGENIWLANVRFYPWYATKATLDGSFESKKRSLRLIRQKQAPAPLKMDIEAAFSQSSAKRTVFQATPTAKPPMLPPMQQTRQDSLTVPRAPERQQPHSANPSLYPAVVQAKLAVQARRLSRGSPSLPEWPRTAGPASRPLPASPNPSRKLVPRPPTTAQPQSFPSEQFPQTAPLRVASRRGSGSPTRRGPPPPLNLKGISAYQAIDARSSRN
ncbi:hypothetical protein C8Q75DRAFT_801644 [Abortiporus biennis]|nr:hypothetical protein C8Q75DRAFT_801644 [Abortiporus biennis]